MVKVYFLFFDSLQNQNRRKRFRGRTDSIFGFFGCFNLVFDISIADCFCVDNLPVLRNGNTSHKLVVFFKFIEIIVQLCLVEEILCKYATT